jgi:hypothetical protein
VIVRYCCDGAIGTAAENIAVGFPSTTDTVLRESRDSQNAVISVTTVLPPTPCTAVASENRVVDVV